MIVHLILLLLMAISLELTSATSHSVLERYEERLNSALSKRTGVPRTVKRYKCVEEYVTYDQNGRAVTSYQGNRFTTTMEPPVYRTSGEKEIRRKPAKKVTIAINREEAEATTALTTSTGKTSSTATLKPFDEMDDEEADRIIEEMYLKKKESRVTESQEENDVSPSPQKSTEVIRKTTQSPPPHHIYATDSTSSSGIQQNSLQKQNNKIEPDDSGEDYRESVYHRGSRKRPFEMENYEDEYDDLPLYRPLRRELRMRRRRPILYSDDFSDDIGFDNSPRRQTTRDLNPLRSMKRLRHTVPYGPPSYRQSMPAPINLPVSASTNMIHNNPMPLPGVPPIRVASSGMAPKIPLAPMPPGLSVLPRARPSALPPPISPQPIQPIQQQNSEVLKMKPILQSNPQEMQVANEESCAKITKLAKSFNIKDVSKWARSNCSFLQMYAPTASCELIFHFIDSCKSKKFF
uniref:aECM cysteine-cradle domain-containing protein n=1 Tax=Caenorhabditis japonica TaxID=281687 RepID=A0A8R1I8Y5_CAEJA